MDKEYTDSKEYKVLWDMALLQSIELQHSLGIEIHPDELLDVDRVDQFERDLRLALSNLEELEAYRVDMGL